MKVQRIPGLVDFLFSTVELEEIILNACTDDLNNITNGATELKDIIRSSSLNNLSYITTGTIPPDPAEVLESIAMKNFLEKMKNRFDIVIIDSAPIIPVIDSLILSRLADGTILVVSADRTEMELMVDAIDLMKKDNVPFLGTVLNNFKCKKGYGYYSKYYYNYSSNGNGDRKPKVKS